MVVQLKEMAIDTTVDSTAEMVTAMGSCTASDLAKCLGITVILARERYDFFSTASSLMD